MRIYLMTAVFLAMGSALAGSSWCNVTYSTGNEANVPKDSGFFPDGGATPGSGVSFTVHGTRAGMGVLHTRTGIVSPISESRTAPLPIGILVGALSWDSNDTKVLHYPSCFHAFGHNSVTVEARYVAPESLQQHGIIQTKSYCYTGQVERTSTTEFFIPEFPGDQWQPCGKDNS